MLKLVTLFIILAAAHTPFYYRTLPPQKFHVVCSDFLWGEGRKGTKLILQATVYAVAAPLDSESSHDRGLSEEKMADFDRAKIGHFSRR